MKEEQKPFKCICLYCNGQGWTAEVSYGLPPEQYQLECPACDCKGYIECMECPYE